MVNKEKVVLEILGGQLVFKVNGVSDEIFNRRYEYAKELLTRLIEKEFTPLTRDEIKRELMDKII